MKVQEKRSQSHGEGTEQKHKMMTRKQNGESKSGTHDTQSSPSKKAKSENQQHDGDTKQNSMKKAKISQLPWTSMMSFVRLLRTASQSSKCVICLRLIPMVPTMLLPESGKCCARLCIN